MLHESQIFFIIIIGIFILLSRESDEALYKYSLYSLYYDEARDEWRGPSPRLTPGNTENPNSKKYRNGDKPSATLRAFWPTRKANLHLPRYWRCL